MFNRFANDIQSVEDFLFGTASRRREYFLFPFLSANDTLRPTNIRLSLALAHDLLLNRVSAGSLSATLDLACAFMQTQIETQKHNELGRSGIISDVAV